MSVLTSLIASHGTKMNSHYDALIASNAHLWEKVKRKVVQLTELRYEFSNMEEKYEKVQKGCRALDHENEDLRSFRDASSDEPTKPPHHAQSPPSYLRTSPQVNHKVSRSYRKSTSYICDLKGNDLLKGSCGTDLYSITLQDTSTPNPICLMAKASSSQTWLWHRHLLHLNFDTIKLLSKYDIMIGLPKLKFIKDHLCSSCDLGKAKRKSFKTKNTPSAKRLLQILHMDLCGPMRVESFIGKKYVLVIVDDYSRYTSTHFLRSKDETPKVLIDVLKLIQRGLHA
ncbi:retrovirus-related pol polyprotein from transposon TNT 1-94 [Tanacetum coccineum]